MWDEDSYSLVHGGSDGAAMRAGRAGRAGSLGGAWSLETLTWEATSSAS